MNKAMLRNLRTVADSLSDEFTKVKQPTSMSEQKDYMDSVSKLGHPGSYRLRIEQSVKTNHYRRLKRLFKRDGIDAVNKYLSKRNCELMFAS